MPSRPGVVLLGVLASSCASDTSSILIDLSPEVISSIDGTLGVHVVALAGRAPSGGEPIEIVTEYKDRNGILHAIAPITGETDDAGIFDAVLTGLLWDGTGTISATIGGTSIAASATFAVLDRTAPQVTINPPASQVRAGADIALTVRARDEIGISQVVFETSGLVVKDDSTLVTSGTLDTTVTFDVGVPDNAVAGQTITVYALGEDLSGNRGAAKPLTLTVVP